jgi:hypothetical protein
VAPFGPVREGFGRLVLCARTAPGARYRVRLRDPEKFKDEMTIIGVKKPVVCYATAEMHCDVQGQEIDGEEEKAGCLLVEILRSEEGGNLWSRGLV